MARIDQFVFGYRVFTVANEDTKELANALLSLGICAKIKNSAVYVGRKDAKRLKAHLEGRIKFTQSDILGLPGFLYKNRKRYASFLGILIALFSLIYSSRRVWDVRIYGTENTNPSEVSCELSELGFETGIKWKSADLSKIEALYLSNSKDVGWININRRGTVAYVTVKEKTNQRDDTEQKADITNIIASHDGIIEEITVKSGYAVVKPGDVVKKGDLLISGIIPGELGGGFVKADGVVTARVFDTVSAECDKFFDSKVYTDVKTAELKYKILDFSINIFKNTRNLRESCDIIEDKSNVVLFGKFTLPITRYEKTAFCYETKKCELATDKMVLSCADMIREEIRTRFSDAELLSIKTSGGFTENGYEMRAEVTALINVAQTFIVERG